MKKILLIAILMVSGVTSAQIKLTGVVKDSIGDPLEMANVVAIDTIAKRIASYGFTDAKGNYKLDLKKNTIYNVRISYVGMRTADLVFKTGEVDLVKNVALAYDNTLDEINIVSKMPVTIKGDTIIYNADSFKNGTERKLEDVLKKIPGMEVNDAGEIEVEGKVVEKVMIDGKEFFSGDTKLATKNIPSNAVDKIQVLRNYGDVGQLKGVQDNQDRVALNIKLKKGKDNFWFGDITAGLGDSPNTGLYLFQPKLFYYSPKYTINVIGDVNNLGDVVLNRNDLRSFGGGFRSQSPSNGTNINLGTAGIGSLTADARNANRIETKLSAFNFSYTPNKKLDLSGFLIFSNNRSGQQNNRLVDYVDPATPDDFTQSITDQNSSTGLFNFRSIYKPNFNNQMNYNITGRFSNDRRIDDVNSLVLSDIRETEESTPFNVSQNLSYFYTANEKNIFALEVQHVLQDEDPFYVASLENDPLNNNPTDDPSLDEFEDGFDDAAETLGLDRSNLFYTLNQNRRVKSNQADAKLDYYHILNSRSNLNFVTGTILSKQNFDSRFFQVLDNGDVLNPTPTIPGVTDPQITNDTEYSFTDVYVGLRYRLKTGIFTVTPGFTAHSYVSKNTQYGTEFFEDKFTKILPEFRLVAQFKQSESLQFNYTQRVNFTDVNSIARGIVANSYNSFFTGTEDLTNATTHNLNLNYRSFNLFNYTNVFARISYVKTIDQINSNTIFEPGSVVSSSTRLNSPFDNERFSAFGNVGKTFNKIRTSVGGNFSWNKTFQFVNRQENVNEVYSQSYNARVSTNFRKAPNVSLRYSVSFADQSNSARTADVKSTTHSPRISFDAYIWNSVTVRSDFSFNEVRQNGAVTNKFKIWNATLAYRKNRDAKWEYEIQGSNLLGTGSQASVNNGVISFSVNERFILPRFVSFRVRYQL
ncbi:MAG: carboxypeptidase regulatory-like domain-containing protein [Flavobacteriaceae bacterium]